MKKSFIPKFSILGFILMAVSAVTAAIIPSKIKPEASRFDNPGSMTYSNDNIALISCTPTGSIQQACMVTVASATSYWIFAASVSNASTIGDLAFKVTPNA